MGGTQIRGEQILDSSIASVDLQDGSIIQSKIDSLRPVSNNNNTIKIRAGILKKKDGTGVIKFSETDTSAFDPITTSGNTRYDLVGIDTTGTVSIVKGTEGNPGSVPPYPQDKFIIAEIKIDETSNVVISDQDITDVRSAFEIDNPNFILQGDTYISINDTGDGYISCVEDGTEVIRINNSNVGIGVNNPQAKLDITGSIKITDGTQGANKILTSDANGLASWQTFSITPGGSNTQVQFNDNGSFGGANIYYDKVHNYVGIGVTPSHRLDVSGDVNSTTGFYINGIAVGDAHLADSQTWSGNNLFLYSTYFQSNVGIGTSYPKTRLQINDINAGDGSYPYNTNSVIMAQPLQTSYTVLNDPTPLLLLTRIGKPGETYNAAAEFALSRYENNGQNSRTRLDISLAHDTPGDIPSNRVITMLSNGNIGIGVTSPVARLDVRNTSGNLFNFYSNSILRSDLTAYGIQSWYLSTGSQEVGKIAYATPGGYPGIIFYNGATYDQNRVNLLYYTAPDVFGFHFDSDNSNGLWIKKGGNVGIGTTAPGAKLQVVGGAIMPAVGNSASAGIYFPPNPGGGSGDEAFIRYYVESGETTKLLIGINNDFDDRLSLYQYGDERLTIYNGNVGIGTLSPGAKLHIEAGSNTVGLIINSPWDDIQMYTKKNHVIRFDTAASDSTGLGFWNSPSNTFIMQLCSNGNVGIGTTSPAYKLDVGGNIRTTGYIKEELPNNNLTATGTIITITAGENLSQGDVCRCSSDGKFYKANATNSSGVPATVIAIDTISANSTGRALLVGFWKDTSKSWTVSGYIYLSTTSGQITQTAPSGSGNQVQVLGVADTSDTIYFNPNIMVLEVA